MHNQAFPSSKKNSRYPSHFLERKQYIVTINSSVLIRTRKFDVNNKIIQFRWESPWYLIIMHMDATTNIQLWTHL
jgi:hypothetical protein